MFEDLLGDCKKLKKPEGTDGIVCPSCSTKDVEALSGMFIAGKKYLRNMLCAVCSRQWVIIYDKDLNIIPSGG